MTKKIKKREGREPEENKESETGGRTDVLIQVKRPHYGSGHPKLSAVRREFLRVFENSLGNITTACQTAGISRMTFYRWMRSESRINRKFRKRVEALHSGEMKLDFLEGRLMELAAEGKASAVMFALKSLGKDRGYAERAGELERRLTLRAVIRLENIIERQLAGDPDYKPDVRRFSELAAADFGVRSEVIEKEFLKRRRDREKGKQRDKEKRSERDGGKS